MSSDLKFKVFVTTPMPIKLLEEFLLPNEVDLKINQHIPLSQQRFIELIKNGIDALVCSSFNDINKEIIEAAGPNLKVIINFSFLGRLAYF